MIWVAIFFAGLGSLLLILNVQPEWIQYVVLAIGLSLFLPIMFQEFVGSKKVKGWISQRRVILILIPFLVVVNIAARKYEVIWDLSYAKHLSIQKETIQELARIQSPIEILLFVNRDDKSLPYVELMKERIAKHTNKISFKILNLNQEIALAKKYGINISGGSVLISGSNWVTIERFQERFLVPGLVKLFTASQTGICSLHGHGENDIDSEIFDGLSKLKQLLNDYGYQIKPISLLTMENAQSLLEQCTVLLLMSPKLKFLDHEIHILKEAITNKMKVFVTIDTPASEEILDFLKTKFGFSFSERVVVDVDNSKRRVPITDLILGNYESHPIQEGLGYQMYMPHAAAINYTSSKEFKRDRVLMTPPKGNYRLSKHVDNSYERLNLIMTSQNLDGTPIGVFVGSGRAFINNSIEFGDNQQFVLNSLRWLIQNDPQPLTVRPPKEERVMLLSTFQLGAIRAFAYGWPILAFFLFFALWFRHRRQ